MNISAQSFARVNVLLGEVGKAIDPKSPGGIKVTDGEAQKILTKFNGLDPAEKAETAKALQALMQQDVFTVSDKSRGSFAKVLGVDAESLKPVPQSTASVRTVLQQTLQALTRPVQIDKKQFDALMNGLKDAPKPIGDFLMSALRSASEDGVIKMDNEARPAFTKEFAKREGENSGVSWMTEKFGENFVKKMPPYAISMLGNPPYFEDVIAALMITLVHHTNEEVLKEHLNIEQALKQDQKKTDDQKAAQKARIDKALGQKEDVTGDEKKVGELPTEGKPSRLSTTKGKLEAVVASIDTRMKDGFISREDATAIVGKLERFHDKDPVKKLLADAMGTALQHSGLRDNPKVAERLQPIMQWIEKNAGKTDFPPPTGLSSDKPLARALMESDRIEHKMAGFLVDAFIDKGSGADGANKTTHDKFKPVLDRIVSDNPTSMPAEQAPSSLMGDMQAKFEGIIANREKIPAGALESTINNAVENACPKEMSKEQKTILKDAFKAGLEGLPQKPTPEQTKEAFAKIQDKVVQDTMASPVGGKIDQESKVALIDGAVEDAKQRAHDRIYDQSDSVGRTKFTPEQQRAILDEELGKARAQLMDEAKQSGNFNDKELAGLGHAFDSEAREAQQKLAKEGKIEPTKPAGAGSESTDPMETDATRSRQMMFEKLKFKMNQLSEMMQAMSAVMNVLHQNAENAIRAIR